MLKGLILENFKAFGERQEIPLAPITLIYGQNSAGKSSIIQALLALKQTHDYNRIDPVKSTLGMLTSRGSSVDIGMFSEYVYGNDNGRIISLGLESIEISNEDYGFDSFRSEIGHFGISYSSLLHWLEGLPIHIEYALEKGDEVKDSNLAALSLSAYGSLFCTFSKETIIYADIEGAGTHEVFIDVMLSLDEVYRGSGLSGHMASEMFKNIIDMIAKHDEVPGRYKVPDIYIEMYLELMSKRMMYRSVLRFLSLDTIMESEVVDSAEGRPEPAHGNIRDYSLAAEQVYSEASLLINAIVGTQRIDTQSEERLDLVWEVAEEIFKFRSFWTKFAASMSIRMLNKLSLKLSHVGPVRRVPDRIIYAADESMQHNHDDRSNWPIILRNSQRALDSVNEDLEMLDIPYQVKVASHKIKGVSDIFTITVLDTKTRIENAIRDVGYGIGQVLPVILQSGLSQRGIIALEQPELHLHPRHQANLGSLFARSWRERGNQFIIETHSEQLILRLQKLIRKEELSHKDVCVLYVDRDENGSHCQRLRLDETGKIIDNWPGGFFEESFYEMFDIT